MLYKRLMSTAANMHHRCRYCIINNVAFAKENTNETFDAIKNLCLNAPMIASRAIDNLKNKKQQQKTNIISIRSLQFPNQSWMKNKQKQQTNVFHVEVLSERFDENSPAHLT